MCSACFLTFRLYPSAPPRALSPSLSLLLFPPSLSPPLSLFLLPRSAYGLTKCAVTAGLMGLTGPCAFQGDYSLLDRKSEENGVLEAASPFNEDVGFMAYNVLAGGMLTGKYMSQNSSGGSARGRMDTKGWGGTLYRYQSGPAKAAIVEYEALAKKYKMSLGELSVRWALESEGVSTLLLGHSSVDQLKETLKWAERAETEGPLPPELSWECDRVHMKNRNPIFANDNVPKEWRGQGLLGENIP